MTEIIQKVIVGLLIGTLIFVGFFNAFIDMKINYDPILNITPPSKAFNATYNRLNETINLTRQINDQMYITQQQTGLDVINSLIKGAFGALRLGWSGYSIAESVIVAIANEVGVPPWMIAVLNAVMLLVIVMSVMFLLLRSR